MKLLHHLFISAVCVTAILVASSTTTSAQVLDVSYSGSGSAEGVPKLLRGPDESDDDREFAPKEDESDDDSAVAVVLIEDFSVDAEVDESDDDSALALGHDESTDESELFSGEDSDEAWQIELSPEEETADYVRRLRGATDAANLAQETAAKKPKATSKPTTHKPATKPATTKTPKTFKPKHTPKPTPKPTPTPTPTTTPTATPVATEATTTI